MKMTIIDTLKSSELFGGLETEQLEKVFALCREVSYQAGVTIFNERSEAAEAYIVADGRVVLEMEVRPVRNRAAIPTGVEVVSKGECFGWSALVEPHLYTLSARCLTNCTAVALRGDKLLKTMRDDPGLGYQVTRQMARLISRRLLQTRLRLISGLGLVLLGKEMGTSE